VRKEDRANEDCENVRTRARGARPIANQKKREKKSKNEIQDLFERIKRMLKLTLNRSYVK